MIFYDISMLLKRISVRMIQASFPHTLLIILSDYAEICLSQLSI
jgi:hypothetical protein